MICFSKLSDLSTTAATPPCAYFVLDSSSFDLVTINTLPNLDTFNAKLKPAMPDPMTKKSTFLSAINFKIHKLCPKALDQINEKCGKRVNKRLNKNEKYLTFHKSPISYLNF